MRNRRFGRDLFGPALLGICAILAMPLQSAETEPWQEKVHYQVSEAASTEEWEDSTIVVSIFVSYAYAENVKVVRDFPRVEGIASKVRVSESARVRERWEDPRTGAPLHRNPEPEAAGTAHEGVPRTTHTREISRGALSRRAVEYRRNAAVAAALSRDAWRDPRGFSAARSRSQRCRRTFARRSSSTRHIKRDSPACRPSW